MQEQLLNQMRQTAAAVEQQKLLVKNLSGTVDRIQRNLAASRNTVTERRQEKEANDVLISHIGSDNYQGGRLAAESMMKATGDRGDIAILSFPEASSCIYRVEGFRDYLTENNSRMRIVTELNAKGKCQLFGMDITCKTG